MDGPGVGAEAEGTGLCDDAAVGVVALEVPVVGVPLDHLQEGGVDRVEAPVHDFAFWWHSHGQCLIWPFQSATYWRHPWWSPLMHHPNR